MNGVVYHDLKGSLAIDGLIRSYYCVAVLKNE